MLNLHSKLNINLLLLVTLSTSDWLLKTYNEIPLFAINVETKNSYNSVTPIVLQCNANCGQNNVVYCYLYVLYSYSLIQKKCMYGKNITSITSICYLWYVSVFDTNEQQRCFV